MGRRSNSHDLDDWYARIPNSFGFIAIAKVRIPDRAGSVKKFYEFVCRPAGDLKDEKPFSWFIVQIPIVSRQQRRMRLRPTLKISTFNDTVNTELISAIKEIVRSKNAQIQFSRFRCEYAAS